MQTTINNLKANIDGEAVGFAGLLLVCFTLDDPDEDGNPRYDIHVMKEKNGIFYSSSMACVLGEGILSAHVGNEPDIVLSQRKVDMLQELADLADTAGIY